jgi:hypothetical protein
MINWIVERLIDSKIQDDCKTGKKRKNIIHLFINSSQNEGLSPSGITLSIDGFGSISWHYVWFSSDGSFSFHIFSPNFQLFQPEHQ